MNASRDENRAPFGTFAPSGFQNAVRALAGRLPHGWLGRKLASALLGPAGGRAQRSYDVAVFETERARLHPSDNICEKRVFLTPHFWDADERARLAEAIAGCSHDMFYFLDVGANAGLYTLFARSAARAVGKTLRAACVEPAEEMRRRLTDNFALSDFCDDVLILPYAATSTNGPVEFSVNTQSRGMSRLSETSGGGVTVPGRTLSDIIEETGFSRIDAMKIDIEGHEHRALAPFFKTAPRDIWPAMIIIEKSHDASCDELLKNAGYDVAFENRLNNIYQLF